MYVSLSLIGRRIEGFVQSTLDPKLIAFKDKRVEERWNQIRGERKAASKTSEKKTPAQMTRRRTHSDQRRAKRRRAFEDMEALRAEGSVLLYCDCKMLGRRYCLIFL